MSSAPTSRATPASTSRCDISLTRRRAAGKTAALRFFLPAIDSGAALRFNMPIPREGSETMAYLIRPAGASDAAGCAAVYGPYTHTVVTFEAPEPDAAEFARRIEDITRRYPWLVCVSRGGRSATPTRTASANGRPTTGIRSSPSTSPRRRRAWARERRSTARSASS